MTITISVIDLCPAGGAVVDSCKVCSVKVSRFHPISRCFPLLSALPRGVTVATQPYSYEDENIPFPSPSSPYL